MHFLSDCVDDLNPKIACGEIVNFKQCLDGQIVKAMCRISDDFSNNVGTLESLETCPEGLLVKFIIFIL